MQVTFAVFLAAGVAHARSVPDTIVERVTACTTCHGKEGRATNEAYFPRIAGKPAGYLFNQLVNFRDGRRNYGLMTYLVEHLTDPYLREISEYFAGLDLPYAPPQRTNAPQAVLSLGETLVRRGNTERKIPACVECHGERLTGVAPSIPGLLGLPRDYLLAQLGRWKTGERRAHAPDCMAKVAVELTPQEVAAVATWLAAQAVPQNSKPAASLPAPMPRQCGGVARDRYMVNRKS